MRDCHCLEPVTTMAEGLLVCPQYLWYNEILSSTTIVVSLGNVTTISIRHEYRLSHRNKWNINYLFTASIHNKNVLYNRTCAV